MRTSESQSERIAPLGARTTEKNQLSLHAHSADCIPVQHVAGGAQCGGAGRYFAAGADGLRRTIAPAEATQRGACVLGILCPERVICLQRDFHARVFLLQVRKEVSVTQ